MYDYSHIDAKVHEIIKQAQKYMRKLNKVYVENEILKAYEYAKEAHSTQFRLSGDPYIIHPVEATEFLLHIKPDIATIQGCFLHDVIEDTPTTYEDISDIFGSEVADICAGMEKLGRVKYTGEDRAVGSLRKMFVAMADDLRVIFIKLADRLHNMKTLSHHPKPEKRNRIALETLNIYSPIADRLGLYYFKNSLDEECLKILQPDEYNEIKKELLDLKKTKVSFKKNAKKEIDHLLHHTGIKYKIDFRVKAVYSIYRKMQRKHYESVKDIYDLYGIRIVVKDISECYKILGMIHTEWTPIPKKIKDYIALPKPNGYKSLHTTVLGVLRDHRRMPTEIQIKTRKMKDHSDLGVAAHFEYKEKGSKIATDIDWVKDLKDLTQNIENTDFMDSLKIDLFKDRIFLLTPAGDTRNLPKGSTAIDFAYSIHTDLGNHTILAKVNGAVYPLDKELHNGDLIEIVTDKNKSPNPFWISFVQTVKAKNSIKNYLKKEDREDNIERGKTLLNKYLEKAGLGILDKDMTLLKVLDDREYSTEERLGLLEQVGNFSTTANSLLKRIFRSKKIKAIDIDNIKDLKQDDVADVTDFVESNETRAVIIGGESDMPHKIGNCCSGHLGSKILAHINNKGIISLHNRDCEIIKDVNKDRLLNAYYEGEEIHTIMVDITFVLKNKLGALKEISEVLYVMNIDTIEISSKRNEEQNVELTFSLELLDYDYLIIDRFIERVQSRLKDTLVSHDIHQVQG